MVDSESVVIGSQMTAWSTDQPVVPATVCECEQPLRDPGDQARERASTVPLERELALPALEARDETRYAGIRQREKRKDGVRTPWV